MYLTLKYTIREESMTMTYPPYKRKLNNNQELPVDGGHLLEASFLGEGRLEAGKGFVQSKQFDLVQHAVVPIENKIFVIMLNMPNKKNKTRRKKEWTDLQDPEFCLCPQCPHR